MSSTVQLGLTLIPVKFRNAVLSFDVDGMLNMMRQRAFAFSVTTDGNLGGDHVVV